MLLLAEQENGGAGGALRSAERRAAAAQQRNLDKKIQALNGEEHQLAAAPATFQSFLLHR